jgi:hypothetical protein
LVLDIVDSPNSLAQGGVDLGYFQFSSTGGSSTSVLTGQTLVNCATGDLITLKNSGNFSFTYGNGLPTNAPAATLTILRVQ